MRNLILSILLVSTLSAANYKQVLPSWMYDVVEWKPIKYGVMENRYVWFHTMFGMGIARVVTSESLMPLMGLKPVSPENAVGAVFLIAVGWEVVEYMVEGTEPYGSTEKWAYDSAGDIGVAVLAASLAVRWNLYKLWRKENNSQEVLLLPNRFELKWRF